MPKTNNKSNISDLMNDYNKNGIPIPLVRYRGKGNVALTLVFLSTVLLLLAIIGKSTGKTPNIDMSSIMQFFTSSTMLFFGHSWIDKSSVEVISPMQVANVEDMSLLTKKSESDKT